MPTSSPQVVRSARSRPEPSYAVSSPTGRPAFSSVSRTTPSPAAGVPPAPNRLPNSFSISSAARLSLCWSISATTSGRGDGSSVATGGRPDGATPSPTPATVTPRAWSSAASTLAALVSGAGAGTAFGFHATNPEFTVSALAGPDSASLMYPGFHVGP